MYSLDKFKCYFDKHGEGILSCGEYNEKGIEYCLQRGADINTKNDRDETPLMQTCKYGTDTFLKKFLANDKIDLYLKDNNGYDGLMYAFKRNCYNMISLILYNNKFDINSKDSNGMTFFHRLCCEYNDIVYKDEELSTNYFAKQEYFANFKCIQRKVNINIQDNEGYTPLMYAILNSSSNKYEILLYILEDNRIDIDLKNNKGETAMDILYNKTTDYLFKIMFKHCSNTSFTDKLYEKHIDFLVKNKDKCIRTGNYYF